MNLTKQLKSSISHSFESAHVLTRVPRTKLLAIWNLLLVQLYGAEFPPFCLLFAGYCDTLGSPFPCHLVDLAAPVKNDTRMDANKDLCREASFFVACVEPTTAVLGQSSRHPVMVVSVT